MARGHPPPHCENTQVLREAITEDDDDDDDGSYRMLEFESTLVYK